MGGGRYVVSGTVRRELLTAILVLSCLFPPSGGAGLVPFELFRTQGDQQLPRVPGAVLPKFPSTCVVRHVLHHLCFLG